MLTCLAIELQPYHSKRRHAISQDLGCHRSRNSLLRSRETFTILSLHNIVGRNAGKIGRCSPRRCLMMSRFDGSDERGNESMEAIRSVFSVASIPLFQLSFCKHTNLNDTQDHVQGGILTYFSSSRTTPESLCICELVALTNQVLSGCRILEGAVLSVNNKVRCVFTGCKTLGPVVQVIYGLEAHRPRRF